MSYFLEPSLLVGVFALGILTGWLLEWIFVQLFVPNPTQKLEKALQASRQEVVDLQRQNNALQTALTAAKTAASQGVAASAPVPQPATAVATPAPAPQPASAVDATPKPSQPSTASAPAAITKEATLETVEPSVDDMTRLTGIGPKLAEAMNAAGIKQYSQLAAMSLDALHECLAPSGIRYSKAVAETWAAQAKLAATADWEGLKTYQAALKSA